MVKNGKVGDKVRLRDAGFPNYGSVGTIDNVYGQITSDDDWWIYRVIMDDTGVEMELACVDVIPL